MALSSQRANPPVALTNYRFLVAASTAIYKGAAVGIETASNSNQGRLVPMSISTTLVYLGVAKENIASSASAQYCNVDLGTEIWAFWYANAAAPNAIDATLLGTVCYFTDDFTVSKTATSNSLAGRVLGYDSTKGVLVQKLAGSQSVAQSGAIAANQVTAGTAYQVLRTNAGATASEWGRNIETYAVIDATNDVTITVAQGMAREITACGDAKKVILSVTGAVAGDRLTITRGAIGATSSSLITNGTSGGTLLMTMTANKKAGCVLQFNGTAWQLAGVYQEA